jgi:uncharacterized protein YecE (DUF72 family)
VTAAHEQAAIRVGCSGWNYPHWREAVYRGEPPRRWLESYARVLDTVEVNSSFYRLPSRAAVAGWAAQTPPGFCFAIKASRYLTHVKRLTTTAEGWPRLHERIEPLEEAGKLGPVLWQLPENFHRNDGRLAGWLAMLPPWRHCIEFRHRSWFCEPVYDALRAHAVALVIGHAPERPFQRHVITADWTFLRFHRGERGRQGNYSLRELEEWAGRIAGWHERRIDVYAYFNNDWNAYAWTNAARLKSLLSRDVGPPSIVACPATPSPRPTA